MGDRLGIPDAVGILPLRIVKGQARFDRELAQFNKCFLKYIILMQS